MSALVAPCFGPPSRLNCFHPCCLLCCPLCARFPALRSAFHSTAVPPPPQLRLAPLLRYAALWHAAACALPHVFAFLPPPIAAVLTILTAAAHARKHNRSSCNRRTARIGAWSVQAVDGLGRLGDLATFAPRRHRRRVRRRQRPAFCSDHHVCRCFHARRRCSMRRPTAAFDVLPPFGMSGQPTGAAAACSSASILGRFRRHPIKLPRRQTPPTRLTVQP